jgi:outer membrane protein OmpA-like peptidoglycan-associated protein
MGTQILSWNIVPIGTATIGVTNYTVTATGGASGSPIVYSSTTPTICTVDPVTGAVTLLAPGTCTLTADQVGNATFLPATTLTQSFTVQNQPVTPVPPVVVPPTPLPPVPPIPVVTPPASGTGTVTVGGVTSTVTVTPNQSQTGLTVTAPDWSLTLSPTTLTGQAPKLDPQNNVIIESGQYATTEGTGFMPNSEVEVYIFSTAILLGVLKTDANGNFIGSLPIPVGLEIGKHTIQVNGYSPSAEVRSANLPVVLAAAVGKVLTAQFLFQPNSVVLTPATLAGIKKLVTKISKGYLNLRVGAVGFVFPTDSKQANVALSLKRAKAVVALLKKYKLKGVFVARGGGRSFPAANTSRRVDLTITFQVTKTSK